MPYIKLHHGPYEAYGVIKHRTQRLHGIIGYLNEKGYEVEIIPSEHINRLTIEMRGRMIFRCDIRYLLYNVKCEDDVVCQRVISVIEEAEERYYNDRNVPKFASIKEGKRYVQTQRHLNTEDCLTESMVHLMFEQQKQFKREPGVEEEEVLHEDKQEQIAEGSTSSEDNSSEGSKLDDSSDSGTEDSEDDKDQTDDFENMDMNKKLTINESVFEVDGTQRFIDLNDNKQHGSMEKKVFTDSSQNLQLVKLTRNVDEDNPTVDFIEKEEKITEF